MRRDQATVMLTLIVVFLLAQSQPAAPSAGKAIQNPNSQSQPSAGQTNPSGPPVSTTITNAPILQTQTQNPQERSSDKDRDSSSEGWLIGSTVAIAAFTFFMLVVAILQWWTHVEMHDTNQAIERAYISLSHKLPGVGFQPFGPDNEPGDFIDVHLHMVVKNLGNTPARLTGTCVQFAFNNDPLPRVPVYDDSKTVLSDQLLLKGDEFITDSHWPMALETVRDLLQTEGRPIYLIGYADYIDQFNIRHRTGWGREFRRGPTENNLTYFKDIGYNYDRKRKPPEGKDWHLTPSKPRWWKSFRAGSA